MNDMKRKSENEQTEGLLSRRAELFRHKLIQDFHLLDSIDEKGHIEAPKYNSKDVMEGNTMQQIMLEAPNSLVRFQIYNSKRGKLPVTSADRRRNRLKNKNTHNPPLDLWAHWVVESSLFQYIMLSLILSNCVVLGLQAEYGMQTTPNMLLFRTVLDIFDYCTLFMFVLEIILKWMDDFKNFWRNGWNIFDFLVTFLSFVPEIINFSTGDFGKSTKSATSQLSILADNMRVFRVLRSLKMVTRFRQIRLITLAVAKAFQAMVSITMLLFSFAYIFSIVGVIIFDNFSKSQRKDLVYKNSFSGIVETLMTLFQLFTLDHWHDMLVELIKVVNPYFASIYILSWICIASFIFRNIFVGIMVNNFQSIRNDLFNEVKEMEDFRQQTIKIEKLNEELQRQENMLKAVRRTSDIEVQDEDEDEIETGNVWDADESDKKVESDSSDKEASPPNVAPAAPPTTTTTGRKATLVPGNAFSKSRLSGQSRQMLQEDLDTAMSTHVIQTTYSGHNWQKTVQDNLELIAKNPVETAWPRDTLFHYLQMMEALQENIFERQELLKFAVLALVKIFDT
ncbi:cation channel sperm-associated protein 2-like [Tubulanus polymorphus]|uniref:cation channel sperm-associated protein 2-like n=1 Tax=Tubulanus polymorphus TaxID=672921 RepID=UPI003DA5B484